VDKQSVTDAATVEANKRLAVRWLELVSAGDVEELCRMTAAAWTMDGGPRDLPTVWVPRTCSRHATCTYSCMRPPSPSRRSGLMAASDRGGVPPAGGC
jgi:hypothetical protein